MRIGVTSLSMEHDSFVKMEIAGYERTIPGHILDAIRHGHQLHITADPPPSIPLINLDGIDKKKLHEAAAKHAAFIQPIQYSQKLEGTFVTEKDNKTPHSERTAESGYYGPQHIRVEGRRLSGKLIVDDADAELTIELPGVEEDRILVRRLDSTLRVRVLPEDHEENFDLARQCSNVRSLELILAEYEYVSNVTLDLGVLTVTIERDRDIEDFDIE